MHRAVAAIITLVIVGAASTTTASAATTTGIPGWEVFCTFSHRAQVDPIISPGAPVSAHMHDFYGNTGTDQNSTPTSLRAGSTNCELSADKAAYWTPTLYSDGTALTPIRLHTYYRWGNVTDYAHIAPISPGARIVAGSMDATAANPSPTSQVGWTCGAQGEALTTAPKDCRATSYGPNGQAEMVEHFFFPNCLKDGGAGSDRMNYTYSHNGACAAGTHAIVRISEDFAWPARDPHTLTISAMDGSIYREHADFMTGWNTATMDRLTTNCVNAGIQCGPLTDANPGPAALR